MNGIALRNVTLLCQACLAACFAASTASAQVVIPPSLEPGQVRKQLRAPPSMPQPANPDLPPPPQQIPPPHSSGLEFTLRGVKTEGVTRYTPAQMNLPFDGLLGRQVSVAQIFEIANRQTARYRRDGFILSQVLVPAQEITDGVVRLTAVEGYLAKVRFHGDLPANRRLLDAYAQALTQARPLTASVLERYLLLMNDLGNSTARGTLVPSPDTPGAAELVVDFARPAMDVAVAASSRNSRSLGPQRLTATIDGYGAFTTWDRFGLHCGSSLDDELNFAGLSYASVFGTRGVQWTASLMGLRSTPGPAANLPDPDLETESVSGTLQLTVPIMRSRSRNLNLRAALTSFDGQSEFSVAQISDDAIRAVRLALSFDHADRWRGINTVDLEYSQGLNAFGARESASIDSPRSRQNGKSNFAKANLFAARLQGLGAGWSVLTAVSLQQSFDTLLAPELFAFGGEPFGRAYDSAEIVGDSGEAAKVELRYSPAPGPRGSTAYSLYSFYDWGRVRRREPLNEPARETASAAGAGLRFTGQQGHWQGFLEIAVPLDHDVAAEGNREPRVFAGMQFRP